MFETFTHRRIDTSEAVINLRHAGSGPPLLLLHGHPQTHVMWHKVAPRLARDFTVVAPDLRGYGDSSKPPTTETTSPIRSAPWRATRSRSCASSASTRFAVAGHDRGGRCAYRMALDHPERDRRLAVLDIIPTGEHFRRTDMAFGIGYWHWFFLAQPFDLPERLIASDPESSTAAATRTSSTPRRLPTTAAAPPTRRRSTPCARTTAPAPPRLRSSTKQDRGRTAIACPVLALWAAAGRLDDGTTCWPSGATGPTDVDGHAIDCGHYLAEEAPDETLAALEPFLARAFGG